MLSLKHVVIFDIIHIFKNFTKKSQLESEQIYTMKLTINITEISNPEMKEIKWLVKACRSRYKSIL